MDLRSNPTYRQGRDLIKSGKSFYLCDEYGERKYFAPGQFCYSISYLSGYLKLEEEFFGSASHIELA